MKSDLGIKKVFISFRAEQNYRNLLSMWRRRWECGSTGAGIILFFWEDPGNHHSGRERHGETN